MPKGRAVVEGGTGTGWRGKGPWAALAGLVALHVILAALLFDPKPFLGGDNAGYMILADALRTGRGYRDIYLPGAPLHAQYPPVYPTILAVVALLGGGLISFKTLSVGFTTASLLVLYLLARRRLDGTAAFGVTVPFALSPLVLDYSHWVLSEAPFLLLTLVALWGGVQMEDDRSRPVIVATIFALLAYLTRAAGLPLIAALLLALAWRRDWKRLGRVAIAAGAVIGGWWVWGRLAATGSARVYTNNFLLINPYQPELGYVGPGDLIVRLVNNIRLYGVEVLPRALAGQSALGAFALPGILTALAILALAIAGWGGSVGRRRIGLLEAFIFFYAGLILLWPQVWTDRRFLLPLLPVILLFAVEGAIWAFEFVRVGRPGWVLPALGILIGLLAIPDHVRTASVNQRCLRFYRQGDRLACYPPAWRSFFQAASWVRDGTPADVVVVSRKPRLFFLFGRRQGDVYPFTTDDRRMLDFFDTLGADYVVVAGLSATTGRYLVPAIERNRDRFQLAYRVGDPPATTFVLRYLRGPGSGAAQPGGPGGGGR